MWMTFPIGLSFCELKSICSHRTFVIFPSFSFRQCMLVRAIAASLCSQRANNSVHFVDITLAHAAHPLLCPLGYSGIIIYLHLLHVTGHLTYISSPCSALSRLCLTAFCYLHSGIHVYSHASIFHCHACYTLRQAGNSLSPPLPLAFCRICKHPDPANIGCTEFCGPLTTVTYHLCIFIDAASIFHLPILCPRRLPSRHLLSDCRHSLFPPLPGFAYPLFWLSHASGRTMWSITSRSLRFHFRFRATT